MMEKAKTAPSTSHSSETRWRGAMHFHQNSPGRARSLRRPVADSFTLSVAVANGPRGLVEVEYCTQMLTAAT